MLRALAVGAAVAGGLGVSACDNVLNDDEDDDTFHVRSINLIEDSPTIRFSLDDTVVSTADYRAGSSFSAAHSGTLELTLSALRPVSLADDDDDDEDDEIAVGDPVEQTFTATTNYTLIAAGQMAEPRLIVLEDPKERDEVEDNKLVWRIVHAAPGAPEVDVYITAPEAGITSAQYVDTLTFSDATSAMELTLQSTDEDEEEGEAARFADFTLEIFDTASRQRLYTSAETRFVEQNRVLFAISDNPGPGPAPVTVLAYGTTGGSSTMNDPDNHARVRFVHLSPDTPPLNIMDFGFQAPLIGNVAFRGHSDYATVPTGEVGLIGVPTDNSGVFIFLEEFTAAVDVSYAAYAIGTLADVDAYVFTTDTRSVPTRAKLRFLNASPMLSELDRLDLYVTLEGEAVDFDDEDTVPTFASLAYRGITDYLVLREGSYDVLFVFEDTEDVALGPVTFQVDTGGIDTLVVLDSETGEQELLTISELVD